MKLLTYASRLQLLHFLLLFGIFSILFYLVLSWNVLQNVDEVLYNRKINLLAYLEESPKAPFKEDNPLDDFTFYFLDKESFIKGQDRYSDTLIYEPVDDELDEYRKLTTFVELHGNYYKLEIVKPHLEAAEMIGAIAITLGGLFLGLTLSFYLFQGIISRKIWDPFYEMLKKLRHFRLDKQGLLELSNSRIEEFQMLNEAIKELVRKNTEVFESQKQFIENASHEMQTPLSVIQSRLETLIGQVQSASGLLVKFDFEDNPADQLPSGWTEHYTGSGDTEWKVKEDNGNKVLAQLYSDNPNNHFNVVVNDSISIKDMELTARLKGVIGKHDQGGGFVWRFSDKNNYYVVRANPLEDNVVLYKVENGKRTDLPLVGKGRTYGTDVPAMGHNWHTLKLTVKNDLFTVRLDDKELFEVQDNTFPNAGKVGFWTKADAVTYFDNFEIEKFK